MWLQVAEISMQNDVKTQLFSYFTYCFEKKALLKKGEINLKRSCWSTNLSKLLQKLIAMPNSKKMCQQWWLLETNTGKYSFENTL